MPRLVEPDLIRARFSAALSAMYRQEVPAYGTLMELVAAVNARTLDQDPVLRQQLERGGTLDRVSVERHGAIRLGTARELHDMRRIFAVMGMFPVGYYDLSPAGVPVHSTAFRPVTAQALAVNPFRVFTSLLRLELIQDKDLRRIAAQVLERRRIFTPRALELTAQAETAGGLTEAQAAEFVAEAVETFRWHAEARVNATTYQRLHDAHRLIADVVSFKGPHINHLTPRTLDIDAVQALMPEHGIAPKAVIEGPPRRACPILLRQTSFKALQEPVLFPDAGGPAVPGRHTARFGEIEQRGIALTPKGRALYDKLLAQTRAVARPSADGGNAAEYVAALEATFAAFPDDWDQIRRQGLGYFQFAPVPGRAIDPKADPETLLAQGAITATPLVYEDFLPVSAAGIFQSNLGDHAARDLQASPNQRAFEEALGAGVLDEFQHYAAIQAASLESCGKAGAGPIATLD
ncbi:MAG: VOC family protein [Paracoccus sp. (in: a-proteobacteria)]|uniref:2-oxoadipate dioxygenase/decarboxylase HglS n=1 Tax=Paracoccus sp. TaxID=267 RepID=UPI0039E45DD5